MRLDEFDALDRDLDALSASLREAEAALRRFGAATLAPPSLPPSSTAPISLSGEATESARSFVSPVRTALRGVFRDLAQEGFGGLFDGVRERFQHLLQQLAADYLASQLARLLLGGGALRFLGLPARAMGGPVAADAPYLVGERGPELFVPAQAGQIVPNHALTDRPVAPTVNITMHINTPDAGSFRQSERQMTAEIGRRVGTEMQRRR